MQVAPVKNRTRDADLDAFDRVSILLDLDRDYATYFHLQIDQRGCVREDCWGDVSWNPKWFVAVKSTPSAWYIEAALPLQRTDRRTHRAEHGLGLQCGAHSAGPRRAGLVAAGRRAAAAGRHGRAAVRRELICDGEPSRVSGRVMTQVHPITRPLTRLGSPFNDPVL